ncbi:hypothetical protein JG678_06025 [Campylobacter sp. 2018MI35]|uniref:hypothetical protein n=1 Tax=Campylobacter molothri TaxID=1032242 RepID=UPI001904EF03|nr:hypothetical protein [Campylobacter sp. 2018MI35]MBK2000987.1 hypothetical protein [Campylobacter sp. 2018MI35]
MYQIILFFFIFILSACSTHQDQNLFYEKELFSKKCDQDFFKKQLQAINKNDDIIFKGLNTAYIARDCKDFNLSNTIFDQVENSYKYDVDLQNITHKSVDFISSTLINDGINDYQGAWYERTMVNVYKGLNFMSLKDFSNARVEFNRALARQEIAKEYFASQIQQMRKKAEKEENFKQNIDQNLKIIVRQYSNLFKEFHAQKNYTNAYVTYISSVFFFMDHDYQKASDLFKEVYAAYNNDKEIQKEFEIFDRYSKALNPQKLKKHIFIIYENGLSPRLDEFSLTLPFIFDQHIVTASVTLPTLKKRKESFAYLNIFDGKNMNQTVKIFDFDEVVASEFKEELNAKIIKSLISSLFKTSLNMAVAKNDQSGILTFATDIFTTVTTRSDLRIWNFLPKNIQILMINNDGFIKIQDENNNLIYSNSLDQNKDILILVRSFNPLISSEIYKIEN